MKDFIIEMGAVSGLRILQPVHYRSFPSCVRSGLNRPPSTYKGIIC